jgi:hypothetical protein
MIQEVQRDPPRIYSYLDMPRKRPRLKTGGFGGGMGMDLGIGLYNQAYSSPCDCTGMAGIFTGAYVYFQADIGWDPVLNTLQDLSGNGHTATLKTATAPTVTAGLNNHAGLGFTVNTTGLIWAMSLPAPGTTPFYLWMVVKQLSWVINTVLVVGPGAPGFFQKSVSPKIAGQNNVNFNLASLAIGSFGAVEAQFGNSPADYIKAGSDSAVPGNNTGNAANAGMFSLGNNGVSGGSTFELLAFAAGPGTVPATARSSAAAYWGGSLLV